MASSDDEQGGKRDERRERRRQRVHDRLANLIEENKMLSLLTQEDAEEIQKYRLELESCEVDKRRLININDQQDTVIKQLQEQIFHLEHCRFVADVQAKTIEQQDRSIKELIEENRLLTAQCQLDAETIRTMHTQLNEAVLERDRLATRVGKAVQRREEAEGEVKMFLEHCDELRTSNVQLAARISRLEEQVLEYEQEDYADFFTRVSRRDIAAGRLMPSEAQFLMVKRPGTPLIEQERRQLAAEAGVSVDAMAAAEKQMPHVLRVSDALAVQQHLLTALSSSQQVAEGTQHSPGGTRGGGVLQLSPEQLKNLAGSGAVPSPKKFSSYALQAQFGISPDKTNKSQGLGGPIEMSLRNSKELKDLAQKTTTLPVPKSVQQQQQQLQQQQQQQQHHTNTIEPQQSINSLSSSKQQALNGRGGDSLRPEVEQRPRRNSEIAKEEAPQQLGAVAATRKYLQQAASGATSAASAASAAAAAAAHAFMDAPDPSPTAFLAHQQQEEGSSGGGPVFTTHNPISKEPLQPPFMTAHGSKKSMSTGGSGAGGGVGGDPAAAGVTSSSSVAASDRLHSQAPSAVAHRRPLASLPVRDALSGSIVAAEDAESGLPGDEANDDMVVGGGPTVGTDSDDEYGTDSPNKTLERNALLKERLEVQRLEKMRALAKANEPSQHTSAKYPQQSVGSSSSSSGVGVGGGIAAKAGNQSSSGPFRTLKELRQLSSSAEGSSALPVGAGVNTVRLPPMGDDGVVGHPQQNHNGETTHYPLHTNGGESILVRSPTGRSDSFSLNNNNNNNSKARKFLAPIASNPSAPPAAFPVHDRPSTCPLVIEAIYGERGGGTNSDDDKMYLVKYISVESEQWTSAANIDPNCDALKSWRRAKAKSRYGGGGGGNK